MSRNASGPDPPTAIGARGWTRIAPVRPPHAGHTAHVGAESAGDGTETRDRGPGPGRYRGRARGQDRGQGTEIIMSDTRGHARGRGRSLGSEDERGPTRGHGRVLVLVQGPARGHARGRSRGRSRAIGEVATESAHAALAPEVGPRAAAAAAVGNARGEGKEVARRMYVINVQILTLAILSGACICRGRRGRGGKMGWRRLLRWVVSGANTVSSVNPSTSETLHRGRE